MYFRQKNICVDLKKYLVPGEHDDGSAVGLPAHAPEVVPGGVERPLGHDELPLGVVARHEVRVDVVAPLLVVGGLQLYPAVVVRQDVGEPAQKYCSIEKYFE